MSLDKHIIETPRDHNLTCPLDMLTYHLSEDIREGVSKSPVIEMLPDSNIIYDTGCSFNIVFFRKF